MKDSNRLLRIDEIRGFTLISMILYHFMWDLKNLAGFKLNFFIGPIGEVWQKSICISFILISGFCFSMGKNRFKRSLIVFLGGTLITAITIVFMPENRIVFGVLTFLGFAGMIMIPINKAIAYIESVLNKSTFDLTMIIGNLLLFIVFYPVNYGYIFVFRKVLLPKYLYKGYMATFLGFSDPHFFSQDYFSIFPWMFLYCLGYFLYKLFIDNMSTIKASGNAVIDYLKKGRFSIISRIGKKTLLIYMLHQPVLYVITLIIQNIR